MVFFEAPHRTADTLSAMAVTFGVDRPAAVCRELTKTYEEVRRGTLQDLADWAASSQIRGEVTLVVGGLTERSADLAGAAAGGDQPSHQRDEAAGGSRRSRTPARCIQERGL